MTEVLLAGNGQKVLPIRIKLLTCRYCTVVSWVKFTVCDCYCCYHCHDHHHHVHPCFWSCHFELFLLLNFLCTLWSLAFCSKLFLLSISIHHSSLPLLLFLQLKLFIQFCYCNFTQHPYLARFEDVTMLMKIKVFWDVTPCQIPQDFYICPYHS